MQTCAICERRITPREQSIGLTDGGLAHLDCTIQESQAGQRDMTRQALATAALGSGVLMLLAVSGLSFAAQAVMTGVFLLGHVLINRAWWAAQLRVLVRV